MAEWMNDLQKKQWRTFTRNRIAVIGMFLSLGMLLMAVFAPQLSPFDPLAQDIHMRLHAPDGPFVLGTDDFGRDVLSRIFWGARISLTIGIGSVLFGMVLGSAMGMLAGLRGGRLGAFIMRCADTMMCFPAEILAILILVVLGQGVDKMLITIGLVMTPRVRAPELRQHAGPARTRVHRGGSRPWREHALRAAAGHPAQHHGRAAGHVQPVGGHRHPCGG